jgi:hypothetical protein
VVVTVFLSIEVVTLWKLVIEKRILNAYNNRFHFQNLKQLMISFFQLYKIVQFFYNKFLIFPCYFFNRALCKAMFKILEHKDSVFDIMGSQSPMPHFYAMLDEIRKSGQESL